MSNRNIYITLRSCLTVLILLFLTGLCNAEYIIIVKTPSKNNSNTGAITMRIDDTAGPFKVTLQTSEGQAVSPYILDDVINPVYGMNNLATGDYMVLITDKFGCEEMISIKVPSTCDIIFENDGFRKFDGKIGSGGFDGLYIKTSPVDCKLGSAGCTILEVIINESKGFNGSINLNPSARKKLEQMSDSWIKAVLDDLLEEGGESETIAREILKFIKNKGDVSKVITAVDKSTGEINIVNYGTYTGG